MKRRTTVYWVDEDRYRPRRNDHGPQHRLISLEVEETKKQYRVPMEARVGGDARLPNYGSAMSKGDAERKGVFPSPDAAIKWAYERQREAVSAARQALQREQDDFEAMQEFAREAGVL